MLAFDYGDRFVGVAIGETSVGVAHPLATIDEREPGPRFAAIAALVGEWAPAGLVVGLPLAADGAPHELTRRARAFARALEKRFSLPVAMVDERLSSADAEASLRAIGRGGRRHKDLTHPVAAQVILQDWLDRNAAP